MKTKTIFNLAVLALFAITFFSFTEPPAPVKFKVDAQASSLTWTGKKVTGQHTGTIAIASGELTADGKLLKEGTFEIDVNSITVTDITDKDGNAKLVGHLKSDDFFGASKFPKASFVLTSLTQKSGNEYAVKGKLTIKGKTNEIEFPATIINDGKKVTATAKIVVDRTKYDIRYGSKNFFDNLGDKAIYDDFELDLKLVANAQTGA
ncbi:MAG: YceI family protein [Cyclobacteriaceae bacterium]|nr:YceI family protein [Cyclobacteriaceae bacterium]